MSQTPETRSVTRSINVVDKDIADFDAWRLRCKIICTNGTWRFTKDFMPLLDKVR